MSYYLLICRWYVDFGIDIEQVKNTKQFLSQNFDIKDLGEAHVILGLR